MEASADKATAEAFATSWNNLPPGSVYTTEQFEDWFRPHSAATIQGKSVLELGCGNASLLMHMPRWRPSRIVGVDLGSSVKSARENMRRTGFENFEIVQADMLEYRSTGFDFVYCIGVLHHLKDPQSGFRAVVNNVKPGGSFHCWVYGHEGNAVVRTFVEPLRRTGSALPWWMTKYFVATPLAVPFFAYSKFVGALPQTLTAANKLPLYEYGRWISKNKFSFFRHVAFDQLVTPQTVYIKRSQIEDWLRSDTRIDPASTYIEMRNGNSWKFGGRVK